MSDTEASSDVGEETFTFVVVRTSDAMRKEITLPLSRKLGELKQVLAEEDFFGPTSAVEHQRIFYLGRELKSGGRSLLKLGLGKFNNRILHLHVPPDHTLTSKVGSKTAKRRRTAATKPRVKPNNNANTSASASTNNHNNPVIDLLDDDTDDDDLAVIDSDDDDLAVIDCDDDDLAVIDCDDDDLAVIETPVGDKRARIS